MNDAIFEKARAAKSPEELLKLAQDNGMTDFTEENAEAYFNTLHKSGEISDDELEGAVGGCKVNGKTVVTNLKKCHNGQYLSVYDRMENGWPQHRKDLNYTYAGIRRAWENGARLFADCDESDDLYTHANVCGLCAHLQFTSAGTGYCEIN